MSETQTRHEIKQRLRCAQEELVPTAKVQGETSEFLSTNAWDTTAPAFQGVREWVAAHWALERATEPPLGTLITSDFGRRSEERLDDTLATIKLVMAAAEHGADTVARYATEFASHGMVEECNICLLKGASISESKLLDEYCSLLPYRDALRQADLSCSDVTNHWPPEGTDSVCALQYRRFERGTRSGKGSELYTSPLLRDGAETLALMLGLVWGNGLRVFCDWHATPAVVVATLPFAFSSLLQSERTIQVKLPFSRERANAEQRPLAIKELAALIKRYATLPDQFCRRLALALRRLRDSTERVDYEDRVIDMCIALEALFMEADEHGYKKKIIAKRGSWYFADSVQERKRTRCVLNKFYELRSKIVHGDCSYSVAQTSEERKQHPELITCAMDVARVSLKDMIVEGKPVNWEKSKNEESIRHDPPRSESDIRSVKSDSLSWTVKEQKEIDCALESVGRPTVDKAPAPPLGKGGGILTRYATGIYGFRMMAAGKGGGIYTRYGLDYALLKEAIEQCRRQGDHYVIGDPAVLYKAHPKWPKTASDPLDERTKYYCKKDVEKHMQLWRKAAVEKGLTYFYRPCKASMYLPGHQKK